MPISGQAQEPWHAEPAVGHFQLQADLPSMLAPDVGANGRLAERTNRPPPICKWQISGPPPSKTRRKEQKWRRARMRGIGMCGAASAMGRQEKGSGAKWDHVPRASCSCGEKKAPFVSTSVPTCRTCMQGKETAKHSLRPPLGTIGTRVFDL